MSQETNVIPTSIKIYAAGVTVLLLFTLWAIFIGSNYSMSSIPAMDANNWSRLLAALLIFGILGITAVIYALYHIIALLRNRQ